jgi:hypothetical protein
MSLKLITYTKIFTPYIFGFKTPITLGIFVVTQGDKRLKRSFAEIDGFLAGDGILYPEIETFIAGLSWIIQNIPRNERKALDVVLSGAGRLKAKRDIGGGDLLNGYRDKDTFALIKEFNDISYTVQGKIISDDDDDTYDLPGFASKVFDMLYGKDNGYTHDIYEEHDDGNGKKTMVVIGEPEIRWNRGAPSIVWS